MCFSNVSLNLEKQQFATESFWHYIFKTIQEFLRTFYTIIKQLKTM